MRSLVIQKSPIRQFFGPAILYMAGCTAAALLLAWSSVGLPFLFIVGAAIVMLTWRQIRWPDTWSRYLSFGAVLLLACALNRAFYVADYFMNGLQFNEWPFFTRAPQLAVFKGEVIAIVGTLLTVLAWRLCGGTRISPAVVLEQSRHTSRVTLAIYVTSLAGMAIAVRAPNIAKALGQLLPTLSDLGLVCTFLLPMVRLRSEWSRLIAVAALSVPFVVLASGIGMKENIILAVLPTAVMAWRCFPHPLARTGMIITGLVALAIIAAYVNLYRSEVWTPQNQGLPVSQSVPQDFLAEIKTDGFAHTIADGLDEFVKRSDASYFHGWAVSLADEQGFRPKLIFYPLVYAFIPRFLWPAKPLIQTGWYYSGLLFGSRYMATFRSSTAAGFYPALYLGAGWPATIFGALFSGALLAGLTRLALRLGGPLTAGLYIFSMLPFMLRMNENFPDGVLAGPIVAFMYVLVIVAVARAIGHIIARGGRTSMRPA